MRTRQDLTKVFELHALGKTRVMYEKRPLESVNDSFQAVLDGRVNGRLVFDMSV